MSNILLIHEDEVKLYLNKFSSLLSTNDKSNFYKKVLPEQNYVPLKDRKNYLEVSLD